MKTRTKTFIDRVKERLKKADSEQINIIIESFLNELISLNKIFNDMPYGIIATDLNLNIIFINEYLIKIIEGNLPSKYKGESIFTIFNNEQMESILKDTLLSINSENIEEIIFKIKNKMLLIDISASYDENEIKGYIFIIKDITKQKKSEFENRSLEKLNSLANLTAGLAHDIKNPLNSISIHTQLMDEILKKYMYSQTSPNIKERLEKSLKTVSNETKRITTLVDRLLNSAKPVKLFLKPQSINKIISKIYEDFKLELEIKQIEIILDLDPEITENPIDEEQMERCFKNLLINAIEAIEERNPVQNVTLKNFGVKSAKKKKDIQHEQISKNNIIPKLTGISNKLFSKHFSTSKGKNRGLIYIKTYIKDDFIYISFQDNGCGIPEENLRKVFDPYFTTKFYGSGLGLMLVHQVIKEHKGQIEIYSKVNEGTIFTMSIPLTKKPIRLLTHS